MESQSLRFGTVIKAGVIAGFFGMGINNIWSMVAALMGAKIPPAFALSVTVSSLLPVIVAALIYFLLMRFLTHGYRIYMIIGVVFLVISFVPVFTTHALPDGTVLDSTFPLLVAPMHVFSGILALYGIPKWSA